jgi:hypothetical protein
MAAVSSNSFKTDVLLPNIVPKDWKRACRVLAGRLRVRRLRGKCRPSGLLPASYVVKVRTMGGGNVFLLADMQPGSCGYDSKAPHLKKPCSIATMGSAA